MKLKILANNAINFSINKVIEIFGLCFVIIGLFLLISLLSFWPDDPNFIFPDNVQIVNIFGFYGSFTADLFFQSFGRIALLIPFSFILTGINIFLNKKILLIVETLFYVVLYSLIGSLFFSIYYPYAFDLINGSGGFIGSYLQTTFVNSIINLNLQVSYYVCIILILTFFLIGIQFKINFFFNIITKLFKFLFYIK